MVISVCRERTIGTQAAQFEAEIRGLAAQFGNINNSRIKQDDAQLGPCIHNSRTDHQQTTRRIWSERALLQGCHHRESRKAFGAHARWIAARIVPMSPQHTCDDHPQSFSPRRSSAAPTWSGKRQMLRKRAQVSVSVDIRGERKAGDRRRSVADSSGQSQRRSITHGRQTATDSRDGAQCDACVQKCAASCPILELFTARSQSARRLV